MAVSHDDRISSARLLDTLKGLQEEQYLGKEPEVETTTEIITQYPPAGTYNSARELFGSLMQELPDSVDVYGEPLIINTFPYTIEDVSGTPTVTLDKKVTLTIPTYEEKQECLVPSNFSEQDTYSGPFGIFLSENIMVVYNMVEGEPDASGIYVYVTTKTTTTKTKHTIKQDYLPNADWNVNDPNADGYVENRTHWVGQGAVDIEPVSELGVDGASLMPSYSKPIGFEFVDGNNATGEYYPEFEAVETTYADFPCWLLGEDENGNQYTSVSPEDTPYTSIAWIDGSSIQPDYYVAIVTYQGQPVTLETVRTEGEIVHKLDNKYIDFPKQKEICYLMNNFSDQINYTNLITEYASIGVGYGYNSSLTIKLSLPYNQSKNGYYLYDLKPDGYTMASQKKSQAFLDRFFIANRTGIEVRGDWFLRAICGNGVLFPQSENEYMWAGYKCKSLLDDHGSNSNDLLCYDTYGELKYIAKSPSSGNVDTITLQDADGNNITSNLYVKLRLPVGELNNRIPYVMKETNFWRISDNFNIGIKAGSPILTYNRSGTPYEYFEFDVWYDLTLTGDSQLQCYRFYTNNAGIPRNICYDVPSTVVKGSGSGLPINRKDGTVMCSFHIGMHDNSLNEFEICFFPYDGVVTEGTTVRIQGWCKTFPENE